MFVRYLLAIAARERSAAEDMTAQVAHVLHRFKGGKKGKGRVYIFDYPKGTRCHADLDARTAHDRGDRVCRVPWIWRRWPEP